MCVYVCAESRFLQQPGNRVARKIYSKSRKILFKIDAILSHFACYIVNPALLLQIFHISEGKKGKQIYWLNQKKEKNIRMIGTSILRWLYNALKHTTTAKSREFLQLQIQVARKNLMFLQVSVCGGGGLILNFSQFFTFLILMPPLKPNVAS